MRKESLRYIIASSIILFVFTIAYLLKSNYEFLIYATTIALLLWGMGASDRFFQYSKMAYYGFITWLVLHLSGGYFMIGSTRLYDLMLIPLIGEPFSILRYDQFVHVFCYFVITFFVYSIVNSICRKNASEKIKGFIVVLAASSIGAINEIIEFSTVIMFSATGVGDYYNNAIDLAANLLGSIIAIVVIEIIKKKK